MLTSERSLAAEEEPPKLPKGTQSRARAKWSAAGITDSTRLGLSLSLSVSPPHHRKSQAEHPDVNPRPGDDLSFRLPPALFPRTFINKCHKFGSTANLVSACFCSDWSSHCCASQTRRPQHTYMYTQENTHQRFMCKMYFMVSNNSTKWSK